ncbi:hypothetical protein ACEPAH_7229 [Sanghuangporus vaninii]
MFPVHESSCPNLGHPASKLPSHPQSIRSDFRLVICVEDIQRDRKKGDLYVEVKINESTPDHVDIGEDGKPTSNAILPFTQSHSLSVINVSIKQSRKRSQDRFLGHVEIKEDVTRLLKESLPYEFKRDLTRTIRSVFRREQTESTGSILFCLNVTDAQARAGLWVDMAERKVEGIRARKDKVASTDSIIGPVIQAVDQIVEIVDTVAEIHRLVNLSWKAVSALYKLVSYQFKADAKLVDMVDKMKDAFHFSAEAHSLNDRTEMLKPAIKELLEEAAKCSRAVREYASHNFAGRMARWPEGKKMEEFVGRFAELRKKLDSVLVLNIGKGVDNIESQTMLQTLRMQLELTNIDISKVSIRSRCLEGTRKDYTDRITSRLFPDIGTNENIVWLTGAAGAGKSTIAVTISDACDKRGCPAAYLFFERGKDEYISTIRALAYKIAALHPSIRLHVADAVNKNSNISGSPLRTQFEKLLLEPIQATFIRIKRPVVIILDALDECGTSKQREDLLRLLTIDFKRLPSNVRVLVTSRPENDMMRRLSSKSHIYHIEIDHTSQQNRQDVGLYIREKMIFAVEQGPPKGWDWDGICEILSDAADGLFIWASTAVKMVGESNNPRRELRTLLEDIGSVGGGIDSLYAIVLEQSGISWHNREAKEEFAKILSVILFAKEALSGEDIEGFLGLEEDTADTVLGRLRSVLSYETGKPVRLHHASFADYLTSDRSNGKPWNIDEAHQKVHISERCFDVMGEKLHFNICGIESSFMRNDEIPDLRDRIQKAIPRHLDYACRFWSVHFCEVPDPKDLSGHLKTFANHRLLYWFEVLSLTGYFIHVAAGALNDANLKITSLDSQLSSFLWAAYRLANIFVYPISRSAPHIYLSAISLWKGESLVADHYSKSHPTIRVHRYGKKAPAQCIRTLEGHTSYVCSVAFSPDGKRIASGSVDHTIRIWDAYSGEAVSGPFEGHTGCTNSVAFSPDGKRVASGSQDSTIRVWGVDSGELVLGPLEGHTGAVWSVVFSADGKRIASGSSDKTIRVWDADNGEAAVSPLEGHTGSVYSVVFSTDRKYIASGSDDQSIRVWDAVSGKLVSGLSQRYGGPIYSVAFSHDGKRIASCSEKTICVCNMYSGKLLGRPIKAHSRDVRSIVFFPDGTRIASGSEDSTICVWDADSGELVAGPFKGHTDWVRSVALSPDGKRIASGSFDHTIRIWDAESGKFVSDESKMRSGPVNSIAFSPNGQRIASGSRDHTVRVWDTESGGLVPASFKCRTDWASIAFSPDGRHIASASAVNAVCISDAGNGKLVLDPLKGHTGPVWSVAFSPNGRLVASGSWDGTICVWDVSSGKLAASPFTGHRGSINSVSFSPDGRYIASGSNDETICGWDVGSGELVCSPFVGHTGWIWSVMYSPDGKCIASGSSDNTVRVWNAKSGKLLWCSFEGHIDDVRSVAFSIDGKYIASGSDDMSICIWDVDNGKLVWGPFRGHSGWVLSVVFSPDGKHLASGSEDGMIRMWGMNSYELKPSIIGGTSTSIASLDQSSRAYKMCIISKSMLTKDGWLLGPRGELLAWIPDDMRLSLLWHPENTAVVGHGQAFSTRLDLADSPLGEDWRKGFPLTDDGASFRR